MTATALLRPADRLRACGAFVRFEHTLFTLPLILAGVFSAPGPAMTFGRWLLVALAAVGALATATASGRLVARRSAAWPSPLHHLGVGLGMSLAPLAGYAAAHPDLAHPWGAVWLAAFTLCWGTGFDIIHSTLDEESDRANGVRSLVVRLGRERSLAVSAWLHRGAELCLIPAIARIMEAVGQPLPSLPAAAAFAVWMGVVGLLHLEQRWAEDVNPAFFKVNVWVSAVVLALVLVVRAMSRGGF